MADRVAIAAPGNFFFESRNPAGEKGDFFAELRKFALASHWSRAIANEIELIFEEWWANLVNYALAGKGRPIVIVQIESSPQRATLRIEDNGVPFDPTARPDPDLSLPIERRPVGGLGIYMIKKLSSGMRFKRRGSRNILILEKDLTQPSLGRAKK